MSANGKRVRKGWIISGVLLMVFGIVPLLVGFFLTIGATTASVLTADVQAKTPGSVSFDADDTEYDVLFSGRRNSDGAVSSARCIVTLADGRTKTLNGNQQTNSISAGSSKTVGSFTAVEGTTTVQCEANGRTVTFSVVEVSNVKRWALGILFGGVALFVPGSLLLVLGIVWKKPARSMSAA